MTKEKIIINKIDVTECTYRRQNPHNFCMCASVINESGIELTRYVQCEYNPNCYFKQLKRKEQEYKNLKEELRGCRRGHEDISIENTGICKISEKYKRALDEIEINISEY